MQGRILSDIFASIRCWFDVENGNSDNE